MFIWFIYVAINDNDYYYYSSCYGCYIVTSNFYGDDRYASWKNMGTRQGIVWGKLINVFLDGISMFLVNS